MPPILVSKSQNTKQQSCSRSPLLCGRSLTAALCWPRSGPLIYAIISLLTEDLVAVCHTLFMFEAVDVLVRKSNLYSPPQSCPSHMADSLTVCNIGGEKREENVTTDTILPTPNKVSTICPA